MPHPATLIILLIWFVGALKEHANLGSFRNSEEFNRGNADLSNHSI